MKKSFLLVIALLLVFILSISCLSGCNTNTDNLPIGNENDGNNGNQNEDIDQGGNTSDDKEKPDEKQYSITLYVNNKNIALLKADDDNRTYTVTITLNEGDIVKLLDSNDNQITNYENPTDFCGTAKVKGEYTFTVTVKQGGELISVVLPEVKPTPTPDPDPNPDPDPEPDPKPNPDYDAKNTVYYSNSEHWSNVYAYVWNSKTNTPKKTWPGEKLSSIGTSEYGEKQYSFTADTKLYDRIIFNDGNGTQTRDLVFSFASSGYYGTDGIFTMNSDNYGKVEYFTLRDDTNLSYINTKKNDNTILYTKKFSVYTPANYSRDKKYAVLYMFDSQNLYIGADGIEPSKDSYGSWAVDVAVNNLVSNEKEGFIIVAIDNTDGYRDSELTMSQSFGTLTSLADNNDFRNGKLDMLGNFISQTLMPWVNSHYSVYGTREKTGIAGSSSGGLASYYLGLRDKHLYGYIGAFSPANGLFTSADWNNFYAKQDFSAERPLIYVYCGEGDNNLEDMLLPATKQIKNLTNYGYSSTEITENYVSNGTHSENYWRVAFIEFASLFSAFISK